MAHPRNLTLDEHQLRLDYQSRTDGQPVYLGKAPSGVADGDNGWTIYFHEYNGSNQLTSRKLNGKAIWDNRDTTVKYS